MFLVYSRIVAMIITMLIIAFLEWFVFQTHTEFTLAFKSLSKHFSVYVGLCDFKAAKKVAIIKER